MDEFSDIPVSKVTILENNPRQYHVDEFRLKLMEIADKVEAGVYTVANVSYVGADTMLRSITTGQLNITQRADGIRSSNWTEITADIPDEIAFTETYEAFLEDALLMYETKPKQSDETRDTCIVAFGTNRSDGDTTRYVEE